MSSVAAETVRDTLSPETSNAVSKRRVTMWENDDLPELDFGTAIFLQRNFETRWPNGFALGRKGGKPAINKPK